MKRLFVFCLTIVIAASCLVSVNAETMTLRNVSDQIVTSFLGDLETEQTIDHVTPLYDGSDELNGYIYHLSDDKGNSGYVTIFNWMGILTVTEFSLDEDPYTDTSRPLYYNGLSDYYVRNETDLRTLSDSENGLYVAPEVDLNTSLETIVPSISPYTNMGVKSADLKSNLTSINQNNLSLLEKEELCTQTSAAMIIQYYSEHRNGFESLADTRGEALVEDVMNYMYRLDSGVTTIEDAVDGFYDYAASRDFNAFVYALKADEYDYTIYDSYILTIYNDIVADRPAMVVIGSNAVGDGYDPYAYLGYSTLHALVITGTYSSPTTKQDYVNVVDPWNGGKKNLLWDIYDYHGGYPSAVYAAFHIEFYR